MTPVPTYTLNDGHPIPALGLGTSRLVGPAGVDALVSALQQGYRLIDSAVRYESEGAVGEAIRRSGVPRDEIVITSKLPGGKHAHDDAIKTVHESTYRLGVETIDLYLIHWPNPRIGQYVEAWQALIELQQQGVLRSIGVSNFLPEHLDRLVEQTGVAPAVNQVELHPYWPQEALRAVDAGHGTLTQAWSPVGRGTDLRLDPAITAIAVAHSRTPTQIVLRWHLQLGTIPLPKSATPSRQAENLAVFDFELSEDEMARIAALARPDGRLWGQDPAHWEEF